MAAESIGANVVVGRRCVQEVQGMLSGVVDDGGSLTAGNALSSLNRSNSCCSLMFSSVSHSHCLLKNEQSSSMCFNFVLCDAISYDIHFRLYIYIYTYLTNFLVFTDGPAD